MGNCFCGLTMGLLFFFFFPSLSSIASNCSADLQGHCWTPLCHLWSSFLNMFLRGTSSILDGKSVDGKSVSFSSPSSPLGKQRMNSPEPSFPHAFMPEYSWYVFRWLDSEDDDGIYLSNGN